MKNCPNCGAPIDYEKNKCVYCGTWYYDFSCIPSDRPFFLRINTGENRTVLARTILHNAMLTIAPNTFPEINLELIALDYRMEA